ncbi:MAG: type II secretion system protein [Burkholderiaceae bacterium]
MKAQAPRGFTLIELVITVAIVALLASVAMPVVEMTVRRNREQDLRTALREIRAGIDAYKRAMDDGRIVKTVKDTGYPPTLAALVDGVTDAKSPDKKKIYFLRRLPSDPMQPDIKDPLDAWGKRSYASPRERPEEGDDVFDVYSRSEDVGMNGRPYREW